MYYHRRLPGQRPTQDDWTRDQFRFLPNDNGDAPDLPRQGAEQPDFSAYPPWAHGLMAQVYPRMDQAGRLPQPLILEDPSESDGATEVYKPIHPLCKKPDPITPACEREWKQAFVHCGALAAADAFARGRGRARGHSGRSIHECICGRVTQACGGNPYEKDPYAPPPKKKDFGGGY